MTQKKMRCVCFALRVNGQFSTSAFGNRFDLSEQLEFGPEHKISKGKFLFDIKS